MLIDDRDLPDGWAVEPSTDQDSARLEAALLPAAGGDPAGTQWVHVRHAATGEQAWFRVRPGEATSITITGLVFLPGEAGERINNRTLRAIPLAGIENAASSRRIQQLILDAHLKISAEGDWQPLDPVGDPRTTENFYVRVARQFMSLKQEGEERPVARMVDLNGRPAKTVQGWVTEARRRGLLPPGRQGKAG